MFFNSKKTETETETVKCEECKHIVEKQDAHSVKSFRWMYIEEGPCFRWYCEMHKKPYFKENGYGKFAVIRVDEEGVPVGYTKTVKKEVPVSPEKASKKRGRPVGSKSKKVATKKKQGIKLLSADEIYEKDALRGKKK